MNTFENNTWKLYLTSEPETMPFQPVYGGGTWETCLIIDGPDSEGYAHNGRVVCDAAGALSLLRFLKEQEETLLKMCEKHPTEER